MRARGGLCFQQAWESIASGRFEVVGVERANIRIGMKIKAKFRRKAIWSVRDVYFVEA